MKQLIPGQAQSSVCHLKKPSTNSVGNWTPVEDEQILKYVYQKDRNKDSMMWGNLQQNLNGRSGKSCRERWFNHLDPKIKRSEWSVEEQWVLFILRNQQEEKWSLISKTLMGRTDNAVKNYWNSRLRKRIDNMQKAYELHFERKKKQKLFQLLDKQDEVQKLTIVQLESRLSQQQQKDLEGYMERLKSDYLNKIIEQIDKQNMEYYSELASEYEVQKEQMQHNSIFTETIQQDSVLMQNTQEQPMNQNEHPSSLSDQVLTGHTQNQVQTPPQNQPATDDSEMNINNSTNITDKQEINGNHLDEKITAALNEQTDTKQEKGEEIQDIKEESNQMSVNDQQQMDTDQENNESSQELSYVFRSLETLQMHIDILYKSVPFLDRAKIQSNLPKFKKQKQKLFEEKLRRDEELLKSGKKKKIKRDEESFAANKNNAVGYSAGVQRKDLRHRSTETRQQYLTNDKALAEGADFGPQTQVNKINETDFNQGDPTAKRPNRKELSTQRAETGNLIEQSQNMQGLQQHGSSTLLRHHNSAGKKFSKISLQRKSIPMQKSDSNLIGDHGNSQPRKPGDLGSSDHGNRLMRDDEDDIAMTDDEGKSDSSSSSSYAESVHSRFSKGSKRSRASKKSSGSRASLSNKVMKKIKKQKKKSKLINKIFLCEKQEREMTKSGKNINSTLDPYALKPIQETGMSGVSSIHLQPELRGVAKADDYDASPVHKPSYLASPTLTTRMNQLNICTPQLKISAFQNAASLQQIPAAKVHDYSMSGNNFSANQIDGRASTQPGLDLGLGAVGPGHLTADQSGAAAHLSLEKPGTNQRNWQTQGLMNETQQVTLTTTTGTSQKSQKQVRFKKLKSRKKADEMASIRREEQRLDQRSILKRSHSINIMNNQRGLQDFQQSDDFLIEDSNQLNSMLFDNNQQSNQNNISIRPFGSYLQQDGNLLDQEFQRLQTQRINSSNEMHPLPELFSMNSQQSQGMYAPNPMPLFEGQQTSHQQLQIDLKNQINESENASPNLTHQEAGLGQEVTRLSSFPVASLPQALMDPLNLSPGLRSDIQYQADPLQMNALNTEDNQLPLMPNSACPPHENDMIDDHLIDPSTDSRFQLAGNQLADPRSSMYKNTKRNSSLKAHKSSMKKRMMLQTRNFMNMTMAQMVSDPHHYQASKNMKFRQGGAMTPQRIERGPNSRLENQSSSGTKSVSNFHGHLNANHITNFSEQVEEQNLKSFIKESYKF